MEVEVRGTTERRRALVFVSWFIVKTRAGSSTTAELKLWRRNFCSWLRSYWACWGRRRCVWCHKPKDILLAGVHCHSWCGARHSLCGMDWSANWIWRGLHRCNLFSHKQPWGQILDLKNVYSAFYRSPCACSDQAKRFLLLYLFSIGWWGHISPVIDDLLWHDPFVM